METKILESTTENIRIAAKIIKNGGLVAFPTETVYGLGANALDADAVANVYYAKGRPSDNPMIVHIATEKGFSDLTDLMTEDIKIMMSNFWPGPLTMVVPAKKIVPKRTTGGLDTVAIRMPEEQIAKDLIEFSGLPIAAPSANLSGKPSPTTVEHVIDDMQGRIDCILKGPNCQVGIESTVVDMTGTVPMILRPGIITKEDIEEALGKEILLDPSLLGKPGEDFKPKSPGMKYKHYAPKAEMIVFKGDSERVRVEIAKKKAELEKEGKKVEAIFFNVENPKEAAHDFFRELRDADKRNVDVILSQALDESGVGFSVMNRMLKSCGYNIFEVK